MRQTEKERERRRGVKVLYGVLSGSCIQAAVISGHPLYCVQLYTPDFLLKISQENLQNFDFCIIQTTVKFAISNSTSLWQWPIVQDDEETASGSRWWTLSAPWPVWPFRQFNFHRPALIDLPSGPSNCSLSPLLTGNTNLWFLHRNLISISTLKIWMMLSHQLSQCVSLHSYTSMLIR